MKKYVYILLAATLVLSACDKEDDVNGSTNPGNNNTNSDIIGSWNFTEYHEIYEEGYYLGGYPNGTKITTDFNTVIMLPGDTSWGIESVNWNLTSNGVLIATFSYTDGTIGGDTAIWEHNGNTLIIDNGDSEEEIWTIDLLTSNFLTINTNNEDTMTHYWDPTNDTVYFYEGDLTIKWNRTSIISENNNNAKLRKGTDYSFFKSFIDKKKK